MRQEGTGSVLAGPRHGIDARVKVPASKSLTNRGLIACAVANGGVVINPLDCEDTRLLASALARSGWNVRWEDVITFGPRTKAGESVTVNLGNSGTGVRLLLSLVAAMPGRIVLDGTPRLRQRPMGPLVQGLQSLGARIDCTGSDRLPITVDGRRLNGGSLKLSPRASSQFVSSLLLAAPLMEQGLRLQLEGHIPSRPYLDLTEDVLRSFGAGVQRSHDGRSWKVNGGGLACTEYAVEGDWSGAAFFLAAAAVTGGKVRVGPLQATSRQGDRVICDILTRAGVQLRVDGDEICGEGKPQRPLEADLSDCPDLFPALAVVAAASPPGSRLTGLDFLRHKESDRLTVMAENLARLGVRSQVSGSAFKVLSGFAPSGRETPTVQAAADHRIAMAMAVAALVAGDILIDDTECVRKSFPGFWDEWSQIVDSPSDREGENTFSNI